MAGAAERLVAMSGQFEQRRLARPAYQLDVLDAFAGPEQLQRRGELRAAWRELVAARRRHDELTRDAAAADARLAELRALVEDTGGFEPGLELPDRGSFRLKDEIAGGDQRARGLQTKLARHGAKVRHHQPPPFPETDAVKQRDVGGHDPFRRRAPISKR